MADTQATPWDQINVDEGITEQEQNASDNISMSKPVGKFLCKAISCEAVEKDFSNYSCYAASIKFEIIGILEIEQPIFDDKGKKIVREGAEVLKVQKIAEDKKKYFDDLNIGKFIQDEVNLFNPSEKPATKERRLFVAKKLGLIDENATNMGAREWQKVPGKVVVAITGHQTWADKKTKEIKSTVKVKWDGYESAVMGTPLPGNSPEEDFSDI